MEVTNLANDVVPSASHPQMSQSREIIAKNIIAENCTWFCTWLDCNPEVKWNKIFEGILDEQKFDLKFFTIFSKNIFLLRSFKIISMLWFFSYSTSETSLNNLLFRKLGLGLEFSIYFLFRSFSVCPRLQHRTGWNIN